MKMNTRVRLTMLPAVIFAMAVIVTGSALAASSGLTEPNNAAKATEVAPHTTPLSVAVLPFDSKDKVLGEQISEVVSATLSADADLQLVERDQLDKILTEHKLSLSAAIQPSEAARIGWLAGAQVLVIGRAYVIDEQMLITARIVGVETGRVYISQARGSTKDELLPILDRLSEQIHKDVVARRNQLVAPNVSNDREKLLDSLADQLKGKKLPKIAVAIPEVHYGAPAVDPAAETEMILWLTKCGFTVIDSGSSDRSMQAWVKDYYADNDSSSINRVLPEDVKIIIVGQAFSEGAGRFSDIISAKARVEVRALDRKTGAVLAIARRNTAALDLAENTAGKKAIQDAACSIAYEIIPKLAAIEAAK
jgi:TolB-like protein